GYSNGKPAVLVILFRQPGANIIDTVDAVKNALPQLMAAMPHDMKVTIANDRSTTIRASLSDTETTLLIAVALVTVVVFLFLRSFRATAIPAIAVPVSIIGTFGAMYLMGFSLDNLSLMALTISTGFVVDDAIVVLENVSRHLEEGMPRVQAALLGAREVGFTVTSISFSLIAVFLPILLMGGIVGRLFREFAMTLSLAILVSLAISLTTTPMMCAMFLKPTAHVTGPKRRTFFDRVLELYERTLAWSLRHGGVVMLVLLVTVLLNVGLFILIPKGFFPLQDTGRMMGGLQADQSISFQAMETKLAQLMTIVQHDPAVQNVVGFTGQGSGGAGGQTNTGRVFVALKPLSQRSGVNEVMSRLRRKLAVVPGARLFLVPIQDISVGGRQSNAAYQYTLQADDTATLYQWAPKLLAVLEKSPVLRDVNSDQQQKGLATNLHIDRATAYRLGLTVSQIDNTLYDAFGQRQVSTIYSAQNQYHVVMEVAPRYWQSPDTLKDIWVSTSAGPARGTETSNAVVGTYVAGAPTAAAGGVSTSPVVAGSSVVAGTSTIPSTISANISPSNLASAGRASTSNSVTAASIAGSSSRNASTNALAATGNSTASAGAAVSTNAETMVPLSVFSSYAPGDTPLAVNHQGMFVATTISFNLAPGKSLSDATAVIDTAARQLGMPSSIHGSFAGTAQTFQQSLASEPLLIGAALVAVYIVLGVLYESYMHPITILSTLPSAGVGAVLALMAFHTEFTIIALIGVILLIGIVKKNAIMMIDFALEAERVRGMDPYEAIFEACRLRFRPIMMTTSAAMLGALPLALSFGSGGELRRPLGISILGGLALSQILTLYTTPVVYLYLDRFRLRVGRWWRQTFPGLTTSPGPAE
ncbi:MAG TPA: efflux RND transporter permease subunit, partial [Acetobacteraceae bacterium]|nr:efflux RND transporter permease subunit [Acetobacteraceae bacterium]